MATHKTNEIIEDLFEDDESSKEEVESNSFLNKEVNYVDDLDGCYEARIISITECDNGKVCFTFELIIDSNNTYYPIKAYIRPLLRKHSLLFRLATHVNLLEKVPFYWKDFLNKKVWVSVKTNKTDTTLYENIIDCANIDDFEKDSLIIDCNGFFVFD